MLFSIIIPCYNYGDRLARAITSACTQPGNDYEVWAINDGSTDNTAAVLDSLQKEFPTLNVFHQTNKGPAATRNQGIELGTGDYFIFLDADDSLRPTALDVFRALVSRHPQAGVLWGGHCAIDEAQREKYHRPNARHASRELNFRDFIQRKFGLSNGATAFSKQVFETIRYPEAFRNSEDLPVFAQALAMFDVAVSQDIVLNLYKHAGSLRHNLQRILETGTDIVDAIFNPDNLPEACMAYKQEALGRKYLSLSRSLYLAGEWAESRRHYHQALKTFPKLFCEKSYFFKYLKSYLKS